MANNPITDSEIKTAKKLAAKKTGTTRADVASALGCGTLRAATILERAGAKGKRMGTNAGKHNRTLVYTIK